ncbi:hypothetical protein [Glutamicibacter nicotianae]|uniref:hypothetical protein n=1 Tax=Glutamicibacter nicotianae TaxID=37929 RepID=UPI002553DF07|nr:hypothetical protein [Glutamicibacter nicotianae]WIV43052.1 hypothetical protein QQS42_12110 [Glutamicibacter nicotianae]
MASSHYAEALAETITAAQNGAPLDQLAKIPANYNLSPQEQAQIGQALWHAAQQELLQNSDARDRTQAFARETTTQKGQSNG